MTSSVELRFKTYQEARAAFAAAARASNWLWASSSHGTEEIALLDGTVIEFRTETKSR